VGAVSVATVYNEGERIALFTRPYLCSRDVDVVTNGPSRRISAIRQLPQTTFTACVFTAAKFTKFVTVVS
jgi:hypothetical protein